MLLKSTMTTPKNSLAMSISTPRVRLLVPSSLLWWPMMRWWPENLITNFSNVFIVEGVDNIPDPVIVHAGENTLTDKECAKPEVEAKLQPGKAAGSYGFLPNVLKAVANGVVLYLCHIFNWSLTTDKVSWTIGLRTFVPSPKTASSRTQGRSISLALVQGKIPWIHHQGQGSQFFRDKQPHQHEPTRFL